MASSGVGLLHSTFCPSNRFYLHMTIINLTNIVEDAVKEFGGGAWSWLEPKYIYCGDISSDLAITSRVVGGMLWLAICFLPFLILTLLHNYSDLKFLMKNPGINNLIEFSGLV